MHTIADEYDFFKQAVYAISSSLDLKKAMMETYQFLNAHFPMVGMSLHRFELERKAMHLLFLVTEKNFHYVDKYVYLPEEGVNILVDQERSSKTIIIPHTSLSPAAVLTGKALDPYLPDKDRSRLIAILSSANTIIGHFSLIGSKPEQFTAEHEKRFLSLRPAMSFLMMNLLQYQEIERLKDRLADENRQLTDEMRRMKETSIIGQTGGLKQVLTMVDQVRDQDIPVLITGETGTGKEVIADAVHRVSNRHNKAYVKVNCGAIPPSLIDSELFGHDKGAFTGAINSKKGRFEQADGGTLFLDEIGDMPMDAQVRLLRVLQTGIIQRVGGTKNIRVNTRVIAATHWDLNQLIKQGAFREDLYYRLNVFPLYIPPLRERKQDIARLIQFFIQRKAKETRINQSIAIDKNSLEAAQNYPWPGNIRELENMVERAMIVDPSSPLKLLDYFPVGYQDTIKGENRPDLSEVAVNPRTYDSPSKLLNGPMETLPGLLRSTRQSFQPLDRAMADHIETALDLCNGKIYGDNGASKLLGINPNTLRKRMDKLGVSYGRKRKFS